MKNLGKTLVCGIAALFAVTALADAPASATQFTPKLMNYQGYLADPATGKSYEDGIYHLECRLYRVATGGEAIWGGKYSVYVKDGYFNIMLGDSSAEELDGTTYASTDLWRALWSDSSVTDENERNNLWLGVTPLENSKNTAITSPAEIKPRQQLLTSPYAFRAQSAEYANESYGDFKVNGKLTAGGDLYVSPAADKVLYGQGPVMWKNSAAGEYKKPFILKKVEVKFSSTSTLGHTGSCQIGDPEYRYCVVDFDTSSRDCIVEAFTIDTSGSGTLWVTLWSSVQITGDWSVYVTLLGILPELVDDQR